MKKTIATDAYDATTLPVTENSASASKNRTSQEIKTAGRCRQTSRKSPCDEGGLRSSRDQKSKTGNAKTYTKGQTRSSALFNWNIPPQARSRKSADSVHASASSLPQSQPNGNSAGTIMNMQGLTKASNSCRIWLWVQFKHYILGSIDQVNKISRGGGC